MKKPLKRTRKGYIFAIVIGVAIATIFAVDKYFELNFVDIIYNTYIYPLAAVLLVVYIIWLKTRGNKKEILQAKISFMSWYAPGLAHIRYGNEEEKRTGKLVLSSYIISVAAFLILFSYFIIFEVPALANYMQSVLPPYTDGRPISSSSIMLVGPLFFIPMLAALALLFWSYKNSMEIYNRAKKSLEKKPSTK